MKITLCLDKWWVLSGDAILGYLSPTGNWYPQHTIGRSALKRFRDDILQAPTVTLEEIPPGLPPFILEELLNPQPNLETEFLQRTPR